MFARRSRHGRRAADAQRDDPGEVRGLKLGLKAPEMTLAGFGDLACGSNGGPPRQRVDAWSEFTKCRPEASGLHEVAVRFDDEDEYISRAMEDPRVARGKIGTRVAGHPVILSVLFDRDGVVRHAALRHRSARGAVRAPHGAHPAARHHGALRPGGWTCVDLPPADGEDAGRRLSSSSDCEAGEPDAP